MRTLILMILSTVLISNSFAQNAVKLDKDQPAPFKGVLLTESKVIELDKAQRSNIVLSDLRIAQEDLTRYHKDDAKAQRRKLTEAKFDSYLNVVAAFFVGVVAASFAIKINEKIGDI